MMTMKLCTGTAAKLPGCTNARLHTRGHEAEGAAGEQLAVVPLNVIPAADQDLKFPSPVPLLCLPQQAAFWAELHDDLKSAGV